VFPALTVTERFWDFSVRTYEQAGVSDACLALQDDCGADVNLVLYCCWAGWHFSALDDSTFAQAWRFSQLWNQQVVKPLRGVRRWMKADGCHDSLMDAKACMDLRATVKATELRAEKLQQAVLESLPLAAPDSGHPAPGPAAVAANLRRYCAAAGIDWSEEVRAKLGVILRAAFPRAPMSGLR